MLTTLKKLFIINLIFVILTASTTVSLSSGETQEVTFSFKPTPKIDVVLAKQRTGTNVTNFKNDLMQAIEKQDINTNQVQITSVQAQTVNIADGFSWNRDVSGSIGNISIGSNGRDVTMVGNYSNPGKNAIWIIPEENQEQNFNFSYSINFGDSFNAAGMLLRVKREGNTLRGYMLSFNNRAGQNWYSAAGGQYGGIWEFSYGIGQNGANMSKWLKRGINISRSGSLNVKVDDNQITIAGGGMSAPITYVLENSFGNGYGFFSDHYSHGCDQYGSFALRGISLETTTVRKFSEILREPAWRQNAIKVIVNISDVINEELSTDEGRGELSTRLINENINFVAWGKDVNKTQYDNLITSNNENGIYINNADYTNSINKTAEYIKTLVDKLYKDTNYLLLEEPIQISAQPEGILKNTANEEYPYGKWKIIHDYKYYENNMGQYMKSNQYINDMVESFNKTGKYIITYEDQTISPNEIYVHRRPVASIGMQRDGNNITLTSNSYDLDLYSRNDKGISEEEWEYKKTTDTNWHEGGITTLEENTAYIVQLRVKDYQETWSNATSLYITTKPSDSSLPIAAFEIKNEEITKFENLEVIDTSYDPSGKNITSRNWEVYKDGNRIYQGETPLTKYDNVGTYVMKLTVTNSSNIVSETYSRPFKIVEDTTPPEVVVDIEQCDWINNITINLEFSDIGGSGFSNYQYAITDSRETPVTWSEQISKEKDSIKIETEGKKYLHIIATDNAGNTMQDRVFGEYLIDRTAPEIAQIDPINSDWAESVTVNLKFTDPKSGFKHCKYAITDSRETPTVWSKTIEHEQYSITITEEGRKYLHIITEDNTGNISEDRIYAEYLIDNSKPEITVEADTENIKIDELIANISAADTYSGIRRLKVGDIEIGNGQVKFVRNGTYVIYAEDNVGLSQTQNLEINNIYYECKAGLNHPIYSSYYDKCPICKLLHIGEDDGDGEDGSGNKSGIKIKNETNIYDGANHRVEYEQPENTQIVEYYNNMLQAPKTVGEYNYELKIVYEGQEYETGVKGVYKVTKREIALDKIMGKTKKYDRSNIVEILAGKLINTIPEDDVQAVIEKTGVAESEKIGNWKVAIDKITLQGEDSGNYKFIQPEEINVEIIQPDEPLMKIDANIAQINNEDLKEKTNKQTLIHNDTFKIRLSIQNEGIGSGYVSKIKTKLPEGIELLKDSKINKEYEWNKNKQDEIETTIYSIEKNFESELSGKGTEGIEKQNETSKDIGIEASKNTKERIVELEVKVNNSEKKDKIADLNFEIEQQDKNGDIIQYTEKNKENSTDTVDLELKYFDASIDSKIKQIILTNAKETQEINIEDKTGQFAKIDIPGSKLEKTELKIKYEISITNEGTTSGNIQKILDTLPQGVVFLEQDNPDWKIEESGKISYKKQLTLKEKEIQKLELILRWDLKNSNIGARKNIITIDAKEDIDQILVQEKKQNIEKTNNITKTEIITSVKTGSNIILIILVTLLASLIFAVGVYLIKKYVI